MKKLLVLALVVVSTLGLAACGGSSSDSGPAALDLSTAAKITTYLEGKTMTMQGTDIPSHPNGFPETMYLGANTQCYNKVVIGISGGTWATNTTLGTFSGTTTVGATGTCDRATPGAPLQFASTNVLVENVQGNATCFDVTVTYNGFGQEGRGSISEDGKMVRLELYFTGQATGHRCASGAVGATGVTRGGVAFTGNAVQTYRIP